MIKKYKPISRAQLKFLVEKVEDLSLIDTSLITDMSCLFLGSKRTNFSGIEKWDTSHVVLMNSMFFSSYFNNDISCWNVSNVVSMRWMFGCSLFNKDISSWNVSEVKKMSFMFAGSPFNQNISLWNVKKVKKASNMFAVSYFNQDISALAKQNPLFKDRVYLGLGD